MPLPFFCAVCDKPIQPSKNRKYTTVHDKCMMDYLDAFHGTTADDFNKTIYTSDCGNISITDLPKKPKK